MKRMPFERPTEHYDEEIYHIDEQICKLLKERKGLSNHNPGYPPFEYIEKWAADYEFYPDFLKSVFAALLTEQYFKPVVKPTGFRKHIPVLKSVEQGEFFYTVTSVRQYDNASVVTFNVDFDVTNESEPSYELKHFELYVGDEYDCSMDTGRSASGHSSFNYIISPPLPDQIQGMEFIFSEFSRPFSNKPTGQKITIRAD